jgi:citrate lyase subunit beta/citryl-CoA lyase
MESKTHRLRRSELSTPAASAKMIEKAATASGADLVFLDLEDAVAPAFKERARRNVIDAFNQLDWAGRTRAYRINDVQTPWCHDDIIEVMTEAGRSVDVIIVPKVRAPRDIWFVDDLLTQIELKTGQAIGSTGLEVLIEETAALACVEEIAASSPRLEALILGLGDLSASQGIRTGKIDTTDEDSYPGDLWHYARNRMIVAARANGLDAIDGPFAEFTNPTAYRRAASLASQLGAVGKWCIHPSQVAIANEVFSPTAEEVQEAQAAMTALQAAEAEGLGAANHNGALIDAASARIYESLLSRAAQCGIDISIEGIVA